MTSMPDYLPGRGSRGRQRPCSIKGRSRSLAVFAVETTAKLKIERVRLKARSTNLHYLQQYPHKNPDLPTLQQSSPALAASSIIPNPPRTTLIKPRIPNILPTPSQTSLHQYTLATHMAPRNPNPFISSPQRTRTLRVSSETNILRFSGNSQTHLGNR